MCAMHLLGFCRFCRFNKILDIFKGKKHQIQYIKPIILCCTLLLSCTPHCSCVLRQLWHHNSNFSGGGGGESQCSPPSPPQTLYETLRTVTWAYLTAIATLLQYQHHRATWSVPSSGTPTYETMQPWLQSCKPHPSDRKGARFPCHCCTKQKHAISILTRWAAPREDGHRPSIFWHLQIVFSTVFGRRILTAIGC